MRRTWWLGLVFMAGGCSHGEPVPPKPPPRPESSDPPLQPILPSIISTEPEKTFNSLEEGIAYWEQQVVEENQQLTRKKTKAEIKKRFDGLPDNEKQVSSEFALGSPTNESQRWAMSTKT